MRKEICAPDGEGDDVTKGRAAHRRRPGSNAVATRRTAGAGALVAAMAVSGGVAGQTEADLRGTWVPLADSAPVLALSDLGELVPGEGPAWSFFEPASGRLRTLTREGPDSWSAGPAWFVDDPPTLRVRVTGIDADGRPTHAALSDAEGEVALRRLQVVTREVRVRVPLEGVRISEPAGEPPAGDPPAGAPLANAPPGDAPPRIDLVGSLILPEGWRPDDPPLPAVVLVHGSGRVSREIPRPLAELFVRAGLAAFVWDKRGAGASGGSFATATVADFAADAAAVVGAVAARPEVDEARVAILLASEGGLHLREIHAAHPELAAVVCRVCPVRSGAETSVLEARGRIRGAGLDSLSEARAAAFVRAQQRFALTGEGYVDYVRAQAEAMESQWLRILRPNPGPPMGRHARGWRVYRDFIDRDPWSVYERLAIPVLGVFGADDHRIPHWGHAEPLAALLAEQGHPRSEVRILPDATHGLLLNEAGTPPYRRVVPEWHDDLVAWVVEVLGVG